MKDEKVGISCFTDVLCIWAYVSQIRVDELKPNFGDHVEFHYHFLPLFGSPESRIGEGWRAKGGASPDPGLPQPRSLRISGRLL